MLVSLYSRLVQVSLIEDIISTIVLSLYSFSVIVRYNNSYWQIVLSCSSFYCGACRRVVRCRELLWRDNALVVLLLPVVYWWCTTDSGALVVLLLPGVCINTILSIIKHLWEGSDVFSSVNRPPYSYITAPVRIPYGYARGEWLNAFFCELPAKNLSNILKQCYERKGLRIVMLF